MEISNNNEPIPIEERIRNIQPICSGLYPHEVLILSDPHISKYTTGTSNSYSGFWWYKYGISDMDAQLRSLHARGYLRTGSLEETMGTATLSVLKDIARKNGLKVSGKKNDVIQRILSAVDEASLNSLFPDRPYFLTEKGQHIIEKEDYMLYVHCQKDPDINIWNFSEMVHESPSLPYMEILRRYYSQRAREYRHKKDYGQYRICRFYLAELALKENLYDEALALLFEIIYYDLSGLMLFDGTQPGKNAPRLFPYGRSAATIANSIVAMVERCREKLDISDHDLKDRMLVTLSGIRLPFQIFTKEECAGILFAEMAENKTEVSRIYEMAEDRYRTNHIDDYYFMMARYSFLDYTHDNLEKEISESNRIYDGIPEKEIEERLSRLDDTLRESFYRIRIQRKDTTILPDKALDLLTLEAMERSFHYHNG